ncbi:MAG TPA: DHH family phosphoesterase [Candidatus Kapabacteria bacterium]|nr:DHH family phosphoesterase [Candidatus Kapabacteria bacterium]
MSLTKPEVIYTHESDLDGLVSGLLLQQLAERLFDTRPRLLAFHNQNWRQRALTERSAWVTDLTFETRLDKPTWLVVDHHPTEVIPKNAQLIHDVNKSASLLTYELCQQNGLSSDKLDRLVHLSNIADLFLPDAPDFTLSTDYANLVKIYGFWNVLELIEGDLERLIDHPLLQVMEVKRRVENPIGYEWSKSRVQRIAPQVGYVETVVGNANMIVHQMLDQKATPYSVLLTLHRKGNGVMLVSLRSRTGEALKFAEKLHGGGHPNAAGATLPRSVQNFGDALEYLKKTLDPFKNEEAGLSSLEDAFSMVDKS